MGRRTDSLARTLAAQRVTAATAVAAARLYDELSGKPPPRTSATSAASDDAQRRGWVPPLAWDDIDADPSPVDAAPDPAITVDQYDVDEVAVEAATLGRLTWRQITDAEAAEAVRRLTARGHSTRSIAARLRASRATIRRYLTGGAAS